MELSGKERYTLYFCTRYLKEGESFDGYLDKPVDIFTDRKGRRGYYEVTNWPGTLRVDWLYVSKGRHNIAGVQYNFRFMLHGKRFAGRCVGDDTEIATVRAIKGK
jgi:hypothetical protein